jgi:hypothetical protein
MLTPARAVPMAAPTSVKVKKSTLFSISRE